VPPWLLIIERHYMTRPNLPENCVPRSAELEGIKETVLSDRDQRNVALVALKVMEGIVALAIVAAMLQGDPNSRCANVLDSLTKAIWKQHSDSVP
jgi:hypothetical protein